MAKGDVEVRRGEGGRSGTTAGELGVGGGVESETLVGYLKLVPAAEVGAALIKDAVSEWASEVVGGGVGGLGRSGRKKTTRKKKKNKF